MCSQDGLQSTTRTALPGCALPGRPPLPRKLSSLTYCISGFMNSTLYCLCQPLIQHKTEHYISLICFPKAVFSGWFLNVPWLSILKYLANTC